MINIVMTVKDRPVLTRQALISLVRNSKMPWSLTVVDDASEVETARVLTGFAAVFPKRMRLIYPHESDYGVVGGLKNLGVAKSVEEFGRGDWLYLSDNDVYFTADWDLKLTSLAEDMRLPRYRLFGGQNHPYHLSVKEPIPGFHEYSAVAGTSWLMSWDTWDNYGPLDANAPGVGQSEDTAFCNRITQEGYKVGACDPPVVYDTGVTQTDGSLSVGSDIKLRVEGVVYQ